MNRPILLASALALAVPAFAQNATTTDDISQPAPTEGIAAPDAQDQVTPTMAPAQTPITSTSTDATTTSHSTMGHGTSGNAASSTSTSTGTMDTMSSTGTTTGTSTGTMASPTTGSMSATGMAGTGVGGPDEAREYPVCSRTVTDSCLQVRNSPRPRR